MNFFEYLRYQQGQDRQSFIIHAPACVGKSAYADSICTCDSKIFRLDLLADFFVNTGRHVRGFTFEPLKSYLLEFPYPAGVTTVFVDNGDFLFNTWDIQQKKTLLAWMGNGLRSGIKAHRTFVFIIQTDDTLSKGSLTNGRGQSRILKLEEFDSV